MKLLHVGLHNRINHNAGDTVLFEATRQCFEHYSPEPITWGYHQLWEPFNAAIANTYDGVVVGGGGLLLPDQDGAEASVSGWQWNCALNELDALRVPLILFGIGHNLFRGQPGFRKTFYTHFSHVLNKSAFVGLRERYAVQWVESWFTETAQLAYQPCPTTLLQSLGMAEGMIDKTGGLVIGISLAGDREEWRYLCEGVKHQFLEALHEICLNAKGVTLVQLRHKQCDPTFTATVPVMNLWDRSTRDILNIYAGLDGVVGMRGHSQLIACGLGIPFFSLITHNKLSHFLLDIGHYNWGCNAHHIPELKNALEDFLAMFTDAPRLLRRMQDVNDVQYNLERITAENMQHIFHAITL